jgi:hypothetical protein
MDMIMTGTGSLLLLRRIGGIRISGITGMIRLLRRGSRSKRRLRDRVGSV